MVSFFNLFFNWNIYLFIGIWHSFSGLGEKYMNQIPRLVVVVTLELLSTFYNLKTVLGSEKQNGSLSLQFLFGWGMHTCPSVPLILDFFICCMRELDWTCSFQLYSEASSGPRNRDGGAGRDRGVSSAAARAVLLACFQDSLDWRKDSIYQCKQFRSHCFF